MSVDNITKILSYIYPLSKQEIVYKNITYQPIKHLYLRKTLFYKDNCLICGKCCIAEDNVFLPFEVENMYDTLRFRDIDTDIHKVNGKGYDNIEELIDSLESFYVIINGEQFKLFKSRLPSNEYYFEDRGWLQRCHWDLPTEDGRIGCGIHTVSSLTCKMPHIRFFHNTKTLSTSIGHSQYGRNWALKCPVELKNYGFSDESLDTAIFNFKLLYKYCLYFKIDTWCDEILNILSIIKVRGFDYAEQICDKDLVTYYESNRRRLF